MARPGAARARDRRHRVPDLGAGELHGARLRAPRVPAGDRRRPRPRARATSASTSSAGACASGGRAFRVRYRVFAFEATVRTSFLDDSHGYWNGTSVFFFVDGELARPCRVAVVPPPGSGWRVATALPPVAGRRGVYQADDFDDLVDAPFEVGTHELHSFRVGATRFELALYGRCNADRRRLVDILRRIVTATGRLFGGFPFRRYLFVVHALPVATGGLEHRASVTMDIAGLSFEDQGGYHAVRRSGGARVLPRVERQAPARRRGRSLRLHARELHAHVVDVRGLHRLHGARHHAARRASRPNATSCA